MLYFKLLNEQLLINFLEEPRQLLKQLGQFLKNFWSNLWLRVPIVVLYVWVWLKIRENSVEKLGEDNPLTVFPFYVVSFLKTKSPTLLQ